MKYLITGITGQDGIFLSSKLIKEDAQIIGISRSDRLNSFYSKLSKISGNEQFENITLLKSDLLNKKAVSKLIKDIGPDQIFNLSGPSSVYNSYLNPKKTDKTINDIFDNLIYGCIENKIYPNFFQASSSEMFANSSQKLDESSAFDPKSPYANAKLNIHLKIPSLRENYNWKINSGIMFNHESEFRNDEYLIMKIINSALKIKNGNHETLTLGSLDLIRDWSYAKDVIEAVHCINHFSNGDDYVIGSGVGHSIENIVNYVFDYFKLNPNDYLSIDSSLLRKESPKYIVSNPHKILKDFSWSPETSFEELILKCIKSKIN